MLLHERLHINWVAGGGSLISHCLCIIAVVLPTPLRISLLSDMMLPNATHRTSMSGASASVPRQLKLHADGNSFTACRAARSAPWAPTVTVERPRTHVEETARRSEYACAPHLGRLITGCCFRLRRELSIAYTQRWTVVKALPSQYPQPRHVQSSRYVGNL